jgi:GMP synthase-like glutamine amidotransferase
MDDDRTEAWLIQHEADTPPGLLGDWLKRRRIAYRVVRLDLGETLPTNLDGCRWLGILGSEHSATDVRPPWVRDEIELARQAVEADVAVLGVCFGGQILARAMGAEIDLSPPPMIGWHRIEPENSGPPDPGPWLHFNYEVFAIPDGATPLAHSAQGPAAFRLGPHLGVQFHPEATVEIVEAWARYEADRLTRLGLDPAEVALASEQRRSWARTAAFDLFDAWSGWR